MRSVYYDHYVLHPPRSGRYFGPTGLVSGFGFPRSLLSGACTPRSTSPLPLPLTLPLPLAFAFVLAFAFAFALAFHFLYVG